MTLEFRPILLDVESGDSSGLLVMRSGALLAVAAQLGDLHEHLAGCWFVETIFHSAIQPPREPFPTIEALETWLCESAG